MRNKDRAADQKTEAFSVPKDMVRLGKAKAVEKGMTWSGYLRYCLAKELGWSEENSRAVAQFMAIYKQQRGPNVDVSFHPADPHLNDKSLSSAQDLANHQHLEKISSESGAAPPAAPGVPPVATPGPASAHEPVSYLPKSKRKRGSRRKK